MALLKVGTFVKDKVRRRKVGSVYPPSSSVVPTVQPGGMYYLVHSSGRKFWEISLFGNSNHVRYGKLRLGEEADVHAGDTFFPSQEDAIVRAVDLLTRKTHRGYRILASEDEEVKTVDLIPVAEKPQATVTTAATQSIPLEADCMIIDEDPVWVAKYHSDEGAVRAAKTEKRERLFYERKAEEAKRRAAVTCKQVIDLADEDDDDDLVVLTPIMHSAPTPKVRAETRLENLVNVLSTDQLPIEIPHKPQQPRVIERCDVDDDSPPAPRIDKRPRELTVMERFDLKQHLPKISQNLEETPNVPEFIELMMAHVWDPSISPKGWLMSEKLDGVRCYWNGKQLVSRQGHPYAAPSFFIVGFPPDASLDGELWVGRKQFQKCVSIVRKHDTGKNDPDEWRQVRYVIFDAPSIGGPFEERYDYLQALVLSINSPFLLVHEHMVCRDSEHLTAELKRISSIGGEGVILRQPGSLYEHRRSRALLKVKDFQDAEATVVGYELGTGKMEGMIGAMRVRTDDGREFKVNSGFTDEDRRNPPPVGCRITYKFQELTVAGIPRFPSFVRMHMGL